ncbi:four-carbon acid sugar kinase family protein [Oceanobacillus jeddahense]|uniref:four-carbon acid sugar kinase family protein n=1 Tax=Oceanobacillus jeddahense TaxID=1462527 RepID=UPI000595B9C9|nr:four-carbon acid sugar kinase family protein [Oceanobacillus jeddahense]
MLNTIGVVADDTTGANDMGIMFKKSGYSVKVLSLKENDAINIDTNVVVVDTDSRLDTPEESYKKVYMATKQLQEAGCKMYYNKTCSVFRGNIGAEFDAMLDALQQNFAVIVLGFPKNGRVTKNGIHMVNGEKLENSPFYNDPVHPMKDSNLKRILEGQTNRLVTSISLDEVRKGAGILKEKIQDVKENGFHYCIIDTETQEDLSIIAEAAIQMPVLCGSSAIGEELPKFFNENPIKQETHRTYSNENQGVLVVSGSLTPQTKEQTAFLKEKGIIALEIDTSNIFEEETFAKEKAKLIEVAGSRISEGNDLLLMAHDNKSIVEKTKEIGRTQGLTELETSKRVSSVLAQITRKIADNVNLQRLIVAGGDTSGTVCKELGIEGNYILDEVAVGVPSGFTIGRELLIILKSGSFGDEKFLFDAIHHLKEVS